MGLKPGLLVLAVIEVIHALDEHARARDKGAERDDHARESILQSTSERRERARQSSRKRASHSARVITARVITASSPRERSNAPRRPS